MLLNEVLRRLNNLKEMNTSTLSSHSRNCWQNYVDYFRCVNLRGEDYAPCQFFNRSYHTLCPADWIEKWDDARERGAFPAKLD